MAEVKQLLDQGIAEASSCESKQSSLEKITTAVATTSPPQKSEDMVPPVNTSCQASIEEEDASVEGIPTNLSPIATAYSSRSASPPVDLLELQANTNRAIDNMLHLRRSLDIKRQRVAWELGILLCQNKSKAATSIAAAKAIYSQLALEVKINCRVAVRRPRQPETVESEQPRQPVPKLSVKPKPAKLPRCPPQNP